MPYFFSKEKMFYKMSRVLFFFVVFSRVVEEGQNYMLTFRRSGSCPHSPSSAAHEDSTYYSYYVLSAKSGTITTEHGMNLFRFPRSAVRGGATAFRQWGKDFLSISFTACSANFSGGNNILLPPQPHLSGGKLPPLPYGGAAHECSRKTKPGCNAYVFFI